VRRGAFAERNLFDLAGRRIQLAERALALRGVPDRAAGFRIGGDIVRMRAFRHVEALDRDFGGHGDRGQRQQHDGAGATERKEPCRHAYASVISRNRGSVPSAALSSCRHVATWLDCRFAAQFDAHV
jgi:hypothetical protein